MHGRSNSTLFRNWLPSKCDNKNHIKKNGTRAFLISHSLGHDTSIGWPLSLTYVVRESFLQTRGPTKGKKLLFKILQSNPSILYASTSYGKRKRENDYKRKEMEKRVQEFNLRKRGKKDFKRKEKEKRPTKLEIWIYLLFVSLVPFLRLDACIHLSIGCSLPVSSYYSKLASWWFMHWLQWECKLSYRVNNSLSYTTKLSI